MAEKILRFETGQTLELKKPHPCGGRTFAVLRVGSEIRVKCETCGRDMVLDRLKLEKSVKHIRVQHEEGKI